MVYKCVSSKDYKHFYKVEFMYDTNDNTTYNSSNESTRVERASIEDAQRRVCKDAQTKTRRHNNVDE